MNEIDMEDYASVFSTSDNKTRQSNPTLARFYAG